jgi:hypothetical protein
MFGSKKGRNGALNLIYLLLLARQRNAKPPLILTPI